MNTNNNQFFVQKKSKLHSSNASNTQNKPGSSPLAEFDQPEIEDF